MTIYMQIETPFRLLDEYDVFLDEVSRKRTLMTLVQYAKEPTQRSRQLFIVTPNNLNDITTSNDVRIHKLKTADRVQARGAHQTTLD